MHTKYRNELKFKKLPILYKLISSLKMASHVYSSSRKLLSSYARIIIACICGTWTACCIHFMFILLAILRKHIRYNGVRLIKWIQARRIIYVNMTFLEPFWRVSGDAIYSILILAKICFSSLYTTDTINFYDRALHRKTTYHEKKKKYILKQPQNINRSVCIMKCALESTSTKHCSFISATPVHTFTDADLPEPCTDPHNQQTTVQKWSVLGFVSHEKEAKHCKTYWVNSSTKSFGQTLKKYCWSYHFAK